MKFIRRLARRWPLSLFGSLNLAGGVFVWTWSAMSDNRAGIMLALFVFLMLSFAVLSTHLASGSRRARFCSWSKNATFHQGENPQAIRIVSSAKSAGFPFVRLHLHFSGYISSAGHRLYRVSFERRILAGEEFDAGLALPASGELRFRGGYFLRDALGLSRRQVGPAQSLDAPIHPYGSRALDVRITETSSSASRDSLERKSEGERIFLREYAAGDLARDINWKALARTGVLLTRIPPESPREDRFVKLVIHVPRPAGRGLFPIARALVALDHVRALAVAFLGAVRSTVGDYGFFIRIDGREYRVEPGESLDRIKDVLSATGFGGVNSFDASGSNVRDGDDHAWVIGSSSDPALRIRLSRYLEGDCELLLSRVVSVSNASRSRISHVVPLLSPGPCAVPSPLLFFALAPERRNILREIPASPHVSEFLCGVVI